MPIPQECARKDWIDGRDVVLEDGQSWTFPLPRLEFRLTDSGPPEPVDIPEYRESNRKFGPRFWSKQEKLAEYLGGFKEENRDEFDLIHWYRLVFAVACELLTRNYDLEPATLRSILTIIPGDEKNMAMWRELAEVAQGIGKKA